MSSMRRLKSLPFRKWVKQGFDDEVRDPQWYFDTVPPVAGGPGAPDGISYPAKQQRTRTEAAMDEETFNLSIRKFLKMVGVNSQREIEQAVDKAMAARTISGNESFPATVTLEVAGLAINVKFDGEIKLQ